MEIGLLVILAYGVALFAATKISPDAPVAGPHNPVAALCELYGDDVVASMDAVKSEKWLDAAKVDANECGWTREILKRHGVV